jgi:hypothetical protein
LPAATLCLDIFSPLPGDSDVTSHVERLGAVAELVGIRVGVVSGVMNLESSGVEAPDWRPRHEQVYHDA